MISPELYLFRQIPWTWFCTFTFDDLHNFGLSSGQKYIALFAWERMVASLTEQGRGHMPSIICDEIGEKNGRFHLHSVIEFPSRFNTVDFQFRMQNSWECGFAEIRDYDPSQRGVGYVTKEWFAGANNFEVTKLVVGATEQNRGYVNKAVWRRLAELRGVESTKQFLPRHRQFMGKKRLGSVCFGSHDTLKHPHGKLLCGVPLRDRVDVL